MNRFHELEMTSITGEPVAFAQFRGQVCLVVNVASACGLTPQYAGLRTMQESLGDRGFTVLGFPCNQFGGQEPGDEAEIQAFCATRYDVNFPMFGKVEVNGTGTCELYRFLKAARADEEGNTDSPWNFTKVLVSGDGEVLARFAPTVTPDEIALQVETLLD